MVLKAHINKGYFIIFIAISKGSEAAFRRTSIYSLMYNCLISLYMFSKFQIFSKIQVILCNFYYLKMYRNIAKKPNKCLDISVRDFNS